MSEAVTETDSPECGSSKQEKSLRYRELSETWRKVMAAMTACSIILAINQIFNLTYGKSRSLLELLKVIKKTIPNLNTKFIKRDK